MNKYYTSDTERSRLEIEEINRNNGHPIIPRQIWRDGNLIPGSPLDIFETPKLLVTRQNLTVFYDATVTNRNLSINSQYNIRQKNIQFTDNQINDHIRRTVVDEAIVYSFHLKDGQTELPLVQKIIGLKIHPVRGTDGRVLYHDLLKNIITREFDSDSEHIERSWQFQLYYNNQPLAYSAGNPFVDISSGTIEFRDPTFVYNCSEDKFSIDFYRYTGRIGFVGSHQSNSLEDFGGFDLPFRDNLTLLKSTESNLVLAKLKLAGNEFTTTYILPRPDDLDLNTKNTSGTVVLWETLNWTAWNVGKFDGGKYLDNGTIKRVMI